MIFVVGSQIVDMGKDGELPQRVKKEAWTDGERFKMIFTKAVKEVRSEKKLGR